MSWVQRLNRLAFKVQNLNSNFALPRARHHTGCISSGTINGKIWLPTSVRPPVAPQRGPIYLQHRANHSGSSGGGGTRIEKFLLPDIGEGISEVVIKGWEVKVGDVVKQFDPICEVESDKATATISSRYEGTIRSVHYEVGDTAKVGKPLVDIEVLGSASADESRAKPEKATPGNRATVPVDDDNNNRSSSDVDNSSKIIPALPSARRLAQEMKVDLALIKATGSKGQILKEDVMAYLDAQTATHTKAPSSTKGSATSNEAVTTGVEQSPTIQATSLIPIRGIQKAMFKTMTESLKIPHFNYADEIDLTQLVEANSLLQSRSEGSDAKKVANFAFIIKMVSLALQEYPQLNASIDESGENLIYKHYHNIGVAVDTKAGLIVPNIKNVQDLSVEEVNSQLLRLRELGYASKLGPADLSGATITLSNIGAVGGTFGVPVIVAPEIVIGALGRTRKLPRFNSQGQVEARHIMQIVWSADHRVVDGATLSRFSNLLKQYLETAHSALLKLK